VVTVPSRERRVPLKRVSPYVAATCLLTSLLFLIVSAIPVYADANPNNHGHHYGQLKHPKNPPVPIPSSNPASTPAPHSHAATVPVAQGADPAPGSSSLSPASSLVPVIKAPAAKMPSAFRAAMPDPLWWLPITILPLLFAAWLIAFRRVMLGAALGFRPAARVAIAEAEA